jgi:site-specific recombinase XerD
MEQNEVSESTKLLNQTDLGTSSSLFSKLIPPYLEYVRVEQDRAVVTVDRYRARLQRFIDEMGDCPVSEITSEKLVLYKQHLMDAQLGPATNHWRGRA